MNSFTYLQPVRTAEDLEAVRSAASEENHPLFYPTDIMVKGGQIIGYCSVGAVPSMVVWMSQKNATARDSLTALNIIEGIQKRLGAPGILVPCKKTSPFHPFMAKMGFQSHGDFELFFKSF